MSGAYSKVRPLGRGPFATVYEGRDSSLERAVRIKELAQPFAGDPKVVAAFVDRARAMATVGPGHLLTLHGIDTHHTPHEGPWLISELAAETLHQAPARGALQPEQVEQLLRQVLPALGALHAGGLTHGSIKPSNLFVCGKLYKLGDFGFTAADGGPTADALSPPRYMAPEEIAGHGQRTAAADLYALGLVAYELLLGGTRFMRAVRDSLRAPRGTESPVRPGAAPGPGSPGSDSADHAPATADGADSTVEAAEMAPAEMAPAGELELWLSFHRAAGDLPAPRDLEPQIPEALSRVVSRLARKAPLARYPSCEAALADLLGRGVAFPESSGGEPTAPLPARPRRSRALPIAAAASLAATLLVFAALLLSHRDPTVDITSSPSGAQILFEEKLVGTTPAHRRVKVGTTLTLRKDGYRDAAVTLASRDQQVLRAELARQEVNLTSEPPGATVLQAGKPVGTTPFAYQAEAPVELTFRKEGFLDRVLTLAPGAGELRAVLTPRTLDLAGIADPSALAAALLQLRGGDSGLTLAFAPPAATAVPRLALGSPLHFLALSAHPGSLALFALSADGTVFCVYPSRLRPPVAMAAGEETALPRSEDLRSGEIRTSEPLGRDIIFAVFSAAPLPPLPAGDAANGWVTEYRFVAGPDNPALAFAQWVAAARARRDSALAALEMEVVPR